MTKVGRFLAVLLLAIPALAPAAKKESGSLRITVGVYFEENGEYIVQPQQLVFETGTPCFVWSRRAPADEDVNEPHLHWNAADDTSYEDGVFRWTEYGPEHSEAAIRERCAAKRDGETGKWVSETEYFREQHWDRPPYYLKIKQVEPR